MADIAMCLNKECPSHTHCYRFTATPGTMQSYANFFSSKGAKKCRWYIRAKEQDNG